MRAAQFLRKLLALRRQSGKVKLSLLLVLLALWLGAGAAADALDWVKAVRTPTEYELTPGSFGAVRARQLEGLFALEEVVRITPQWPQEEETLSRATLEAPSYRVLCRGADISGVTRQRIEALGFSFKEEPAPPEAGEAFPFRLLSCGLALLSARALYKLGGIEATG